MVHLEYSRSLTVGRTSSTATNCSSKFGKSVLQFLSSTMKQQSLFAYLMHVSQGSQILYFKTLLFFPFLFYLSHFASTTEVHCWDQTFPHRECSCPSFAMPSSRPTSSSLHTLCRVLQVSQVSRSSPVCSVFVLCHSVHIHFSPTLYAGLFQPSLATSVRGVRRYTVCT